MKIKLLLASLIISSIAFAQHQVNSFYGTPGPTNTAVTTVAPIDNGAGGINQNWNFGPFLLLGTSTFANATPTPTEATTYPGTTTVIVTSSTQGSTTTEGRMFTKNNAGTVSITGLNSSGILINCNGGTNGAGNATLGAFPMVYPFTNTDNNVSGTFEYGTNSGTFTGTLTTTVDAYGTLNLQGYNFNGNATRLKTVLSGTLYISIFPVGTASQTTYAYYDPADTSNNFKFRSINTVIVAAAAGVNENNTTLEIGNVPILASSNPSLQSVWIQNPVKNTIEINSSNAIENANITVTDMLGKTIYQVKNQNISGTFEIPVTLTKGIYLVKIDSENESVNKKIVKS